MSPSEFTPHFLLCRIRRTSIITGENRSLPFFQVSLKKATADQAVVPVLLDLTQTAAETALQKVGLDLGVIELKDQTDPAKIGKVIDQKPAQGTKVDSDSSVDVTIGQAPETTP